MDQTFSRTQFPPGGWQFHQPQTGWSAPLPKASTFDQTVRQIISHRMNNPAVCIKHKLSRDPVVVGNELEKFTRLRCGIPLPTPPPPSMMLPAMPNSPVDSIENIKRMAFGSAVLMDWAESAEPAVDQAEASRRAEICARCPLNDIGRYEEWLTMPFTQMLKRRITRVEAMKLHTPADSKLGLCKEIFAPCSLLAHEPAGFVTKKMDKNPSVNVDGSCWLRK